MRGGAPSTPQTRGRHDVGCRGRSPSGAWGLAWAVLLLAPLAHAGPSDAALSQLHHRTWVEEDGLPQNSALSLARTPDGYLWFGTWEGLVRFDGVRFRVYERYSTPGFRARYVAALALDPVGVLWIGTDEGLMRLEQGVPVALPEITGQPNPQRVRSLHADHQGLWVGTDDEGLWRRDGERWHRWTLPTGVEVTAFARDGIAGPLWLGTSAGLWRIEGSGAPERFAFEGLEGPVEAVTPARGGGIWAASRAGRLFRFAPGMPPERLEVPGLEGIPVQVVLEGADGALWLGTQGRGVFRWWKGVLSPLASTEQRPLGSVVALLEDAEANLWLGTDGDGLQRLKRGSAVPYGPPEGLPSKLASGIHSARDGSLWMATFGGGVARLEEGRWRTFGRAEGLHSEHVRAVGESADGSLWFSGEDGGLSRFDGRRLETWGPERGVTWRRTRAFVGDAQGRFFAATDRGLARLDGERFTLLEEADSGCDGGVITAAASRDGGVWSVCRGGRVVKHLDGRPEVVLGGHPLLETVIFTLFEDSRGAVWIGTVEGLLHLQDGVLVRLGREQGLHDEVVFSVLEDVLGRLWTSSDRGVARYQLDALEDVISGFATRVSPEVFGTEEGMRTAECNGAVFPASQLTPDGWAWFPTVRGVVAFDTRLVLGPPLPLPRVHVEAIRAGDQRLPPAAEIRTQPALERLEIDFTSAALRSPELLRFRHLLEGIDGAWVESGRVRTAHYSHLPAGRWKLRIVARREGESWDPSTETSMWIVVPPRSHETWQFRSALAAAVVLLVALLVHWRLRSIRRRERELEARVRERTAELASTNGMLDAQFQALQEAKARLVHAEKMAAVGTLAAGVGHEINNPLAYILNNLTFVRETLQRGVAAPSGPDPDVELALEDAVEGVERVRRIVQDLRLFSRTEPDLRVAVELDNVLERALAIAAVELRHRARVICDFAEVAPVLGDAGRLGQLFLNLLLNAAQALPEGPSETQEVLVRLEQRGGWVCVEIRDSGPGIPAHVLPRIFEPFFTTKALGLGTGLGLSICHAIVEAHAGEIHVESEEGQGACFRILLPRHVAASQAG